MADEATPTAAPEQTTETTPPEDDQRVPYERFTKVNQQAKDAKQRADKLEQELADIRGQLEQREQAGLPELDQLKKRLEQAEKRAGDAEDRATGLEQQVTNGRKEQWIIAAAQEAKFIYPDLAAREVNLDDIDSEEDAARAVKRVAKARPKLIDSEDPKLPGQVLRDGRTPTPKDGDRKGPIDQDGEASMIAQELAKFRDCWTTLG